MKAATVILALTGAVMAQNFEGQPACATSCLISAISAAGCAATDVGCQCGPTQTAIGASVAPCLIKACTQVSDLLQAQSAGSAQCAKYSATPTKTEETSKTTGTAAATGSSTAAPTGTGTGATITSAPTTAATGAVAPKTTTSGNAAASTPIAMGLAALLGAVAAL